MEDYKKKLRLDLEGKKIELHGKIQEDAGLLKQFSRIMHETCNYKMIAQISTVTENLKENISKLNSIDDVLGYPEINE